MHIVMDPFYKKKEYDLDNEYYELMNSWYEDGSFFKRIDPIFNVVKKYLKSHNQTIADIGTGIGSFAIESARHTCNSVFAVDFSKLALKYAQKNAQKAKLESRITFINASAEDLSCFDACSIDLIICADLIEHVVNPDRLLCESFRILKPEGIIVLETCNTLFRSWKYLPTIMKILKRFHLEESKMRFINPCETNFSEIYHISLKSYPELINLTEKAGLEVIDHMPFGWWLELKGIDKICQEICKRLTPIYPSAAYYQDTDVIIVGQKPKLGK